jgi:hypothetical protein
MIRRPFRQIIAATALALVAGVTVASCGIPTDDSPRPITRDQTTTTTVVAPGP